MSTELTTVVEHDRKRYIGGSDIAGVLGVSDFDDTPVAVYLRKTEEASVAPRKRTTGPMKRGQRWEQVVAEMLLEELDARGYRAEVVGANRRFVDAELPFLAAEIDYELRIDGHPDIVNCELKTVTPFVASRWPQSDAEDQAPLGYTAQVMHGLGVTRRGFGVLAALFGADELRVYPVYAEPDIIAGMRGLACSFWRDHVEPRIPPAVRDATDCDRLFKTGNGQTLIADDVLIEKALRLRTLDAQIAAAVYESAQLEFDVKRALGPCETLTIGGENAIRWQNRKTSRFDVTAFKENEPKLYRQYLAEGTARAFSVLKGWKP